MRSPVRGRGRGAGGSRGIGAARGGGMMRGWGFQKHPAEVYVILNTKAFCSHIPIMFCIAQKDALYKCLDSTVAECKCTPGLDLVECYNETSN